MMIYEVKGQIKQSPICTMRHEILEHLIVKVDEWRITYRHR